MSVKSTLGLEWELGKQMLMLAKPNDHDWEPWWGIREDIDCEYDERLLPNSLIGSTSKKN
jgi:hypothetical protein